jgi:hypothetical protein
MAVDHAQIVDRPATGQKTYSRASGRSPRRGSWETQHVAVRCQAPIPTVDDKVRFAARCSVSLQLGGTSLDVQPAGPNTRYAIITARYRSCLRLVVAGRRWRPLLAGRRTGQIARVGSFHMPGALSR